ncbi:MAG: hypothetical protein H6825_07755 [Planctomycetes bacterium]|nr:hypothetical protein [Planctomycetota bacterium]
MKKLTVLAGIAGVALMFPSCATVDSPVTGGLFTNNVGFPGDVGNGQASQSSGMAMAESYVGVYAQGDASIQGARDAAGNQDGNIAWVDYHVTSYWILYGKFETHVYFN